MKRIFKIRLYRIQEFDLYTLYFDPVFDLRAAMTQAVTAFAEGRPAPRIDASQVRPLKPGKPISIVMSITLRSENAVRIMEAASQHGRNAGNLAKFLVRRCLTGMEHIYFDSLEAMRQVTEASSEWEESLLHRTERVRPPQNPSGMAAKQRSFRKEDGVRSPMGKQESRAPHYGQQRPLTSGSKEEQVSMNSPVHTAAENGNAMPRRKSPPPMPGTPASLEESVRKTENGSFAAAGTGQEYSLGEGRTQMGGPSYLPPVMERTADAGHSPGFAMDQDIPPQAPTGYASTAQDHPVQKNRPDLPDAAVQHDADTGMKPDQGDVMEDTMPANSGGIFDFVSNLMDGF